MLDENFIQVSTSQIHVTAGGLHIDDTFGDGQHGDIERAATKVEDENILLVLLLVDTSSHCSSCRLVDDAEDVQAGNPSSILGSLLLSCIEVSRDGDDRFLHFLTNSLGGGFLKGLEHTGRDLFDTLSPNAWHFDHAAILGVADNVEVPLLFVGLHVFIGVCFADHSFRVKYKGGLILGALTNKDLAGLVEADPRWCGVLTQFVGEDLDRIGIVVPDAHAGVGGTEVDTHDNILAHRVFVLREIF